MSQSKWDEHRRLARHCWIKTKHKHRTADSVNVVAFYTVVGIVLASCLSYLLVIHSNSDYTNNTKYHKPAQSRSIALQTLARICRESKFTAEEKENYCEPYYEYIKAQAGFDDLAAQQTMASATTGLLWASWIALIAGFLTVGLLVITFYITRKMLAEANRTAVAAEIATEVARDTYKEAVNTNIAQLKAYISVIEARVTHFGRVADNPTSNPDDWQYAVGVLFVFKNIGKTPANILVGEVLKSNFSIGFITAKGKKIEADSAIIYDKGISKSILNPTEKQNYPLLINFPKDSKNASFFTKNEMIFFDFYGSIEFKDNFTPAGKVRHCAFRAQRRVEGTEGDGSPRVISETGVFGEDLMAEDWREKLEDEYRKEKGYPPR